MTGKPYAVRLAMGLRRPKNPVPGRDVAGTVVETGAGVTRFVPGDEVYGVAPGSFAEYAVAAEGTLAHKPVGLSFAEASVVPISAGTALQALRDAGQVSGRAVGADHRGVGRRRQLRGAAGRQHGRRGDRGVQSRQARPRHRTRRQPGARPTPVTTGPTGRVATTSILDIAGNPSLRRLRRALTPHGTAVFVGGEGSGALTGMSRQLRGALRLPRPPPAAGAADGPRARRPTTSCSPGSSRPASSRSALDRCYPLEHAADAVRQLEDGTIRGKVAITVGPSD